MKLLKLRLWLIATVCLAVVVLIGAMRPAPVRGTDQEVTAILDLSGAEPNQLGYFPRHTIAPLATTRVEYAFPEGEVGEPVLIQVEDGGQLDNGEGVQVVPLDTQHQVAFTFQASDFPGIHRVSLLRGDEIRVVQFWVEEPAPQRLFLPRSAK